MSTNNSSKNTQTSSPRGPVGGRGPMGGGHGPMGIGAPVQKARDFKGSLRKLIAYLAPHKIPLLVAIILAIGSTIFMIVGPKILGKATTKLFEGVMAQLAGTGAIDFSAIGQILLTVLILYLISTVLSYIQGWITTIRLDPGHLQTAPGYHEQDQPHALPLL